MLRNAAKRFSSSNTSKWTLENARSYLWNTADVVCFDVDSTVCVDEGIDMLAKLKGVESEVAAWTSSAMDGSVPFHESLSARLNIIKPSAEDVSKCLTTYPPSLSPNIDILVQNLHAENKKVYLVSGGFRLMINPVASMLDIPHSRVYANTLLFNNTNSERFDNSEPTCREGGKATALNLIRKQHSMKEIVMIGDGMTDVEAKTEAALMIGYGGVIARESVKKEADVFITNFNELLLC